MNYPLPQNEAQRLAVLRSYSLFVSNAGEEFDRITRLAAHILDTPVALIPMLDGQRQWFASRYGVDWSETPRDAAFCNYTILQNEVLVVPDTWQDPRFANNPYVTGKPNYRFYAGCPLLMPEGENLGTLCVLDFEPRQLDPRHAAILRELAAVVIAAICARRTDARFRRLVEVGQDIVTILSPESRVIYESPSIKRILGWDPAALAGESAKDYIHPDDWMHFAQVMSNLNAVPEEPRTVEFRCRHKDGSWRWIESTATNNIDDPAIGGILITSRDISARKHFEERLRSSEDRFKTIFDQSPIGMALADLEGNFILVNVALGDILGYAPEELTQHNFQDLTHPEDIAADVRLMRRTLNGEISTYTMEKRYLHKGGGIVWAALYVTLLHDTDGNPQVFLAQIQDITERRRASQALQRSMQAADRARAEAEQAREEAERANAAKSEFLSRVSHEFRTPLNAILGFGQLLDMSTQLAERDRQSVSLILKGGQHLLELINEVLDISHIESGRLALSPEPVNVRDICLESLELVRHLANEREITLETGSVANAHAYVEADRQRLRQILLNLFSNAIKFNRSGGRVTLKVEENLTEQRVRIYVTDTGPGISPARQERLFQPFERLSSEEHREDGPGIGLALSLRLAEAMGGTIDLSSDLGHGSTFWVEMPRSPDPLGRLQQLAPVLENDSGLPREFLILYIEDNLANIRLMQGLLVQRPQVKLVTALKGDVGLEMAQTQKPDLILLDMHLPGMAGLEVLDALQEAEETRAIPIVVVSADASHRQGERVKARGAAAYVQKPFNLVDFLRLLDEFIEQES